MSPYRLFNQGRLLSDNIRYRNLLSGNIGILSSRIVVGTAIEPYLNAWAWDDTYGFGTKASNPSSGVAGKVYGIAQNSNTIFIARDSSPHINAYSWAGGFGSKYSNPATLPIGLIAYSVTYNSVFPSVAISQSSTPYVAAYPWSNSTGFGTRYSDPSILPTGPARYVKFNNAGNVIGVANETTTPFISFYAWSSGFGTRFSNPVSLPEAIQYDAGIGFSPSDNAVVVATGNFTSPYVAAYPWSNSTGFGTRYSAPATLPGYITSDVSFSPNGNYLAITSGQSGLSIYNWSSGFGTKIANAATHYNDANEVGFNSNGSTVGVAILRTPFIAVYPWTTGFGTKFANPQFGPGGEAETISFN